MIALYLLTGILALAIFLLFYTQVLVPAILGTPFFPQFRKTTAIKEQVDAAEVELEEETELVTLQEQLIDIKRRKAELEKKE